jgi:hypothetical protein
MFESEYGLHFPAGPKAPRWREALPAAAVAAVRARALADTSAALALRARAEAREGVYRCVCCKENFVVPEDGQDTCDSCLRRAGLLKG